LNVAAILSICHSTVFFDLSIQKRKRRQKVKEYCGTADRND